MDINFLITNSLEKVFIDSKTPPPALKRLSVMPGETAIFQVVIKSSFPVANAKLKPSLPAVRLSMVDHIAGHFMRAPGSDDFMIDRPGLYPEVIRPLSPADIYLRPGLYTTLWAEADAAELDKGENLTSFTLADSSDKVLAVADIVIEVIGASLGGDVLFVTNWLHCDCLADYYNVRVFGKEHFRLIENFMRTALRHGINAAFLPCFTPALDTAPGIRRTPCQLIDIFKDGERFAFGWKKFDRYVRMCKRLGVTYYEISHLFSQWGAAYCPDIDARVTAWPSTFSAATRNRRARDTEGS